MDASRKKAIYINSRKSGPDSPVPRVKHACEGAETSFFGFQNQFIIRDGLIKIKKSKIHFDMTTTTTTIVHAPEEFQKSPPRQYTFSRGEAVCYAGLFFEVAKRVFFCFQVSFCPVKRGNRAGSSRNEFDYSRRGTQISFLLLDCRSCDNFGLAHFFNFLKKKVYQRGPPFFDQLLVFSLHK